MTTAAQRPDPVLQVLGYHQETKHHFFRYARALGYLDWANQPDPFRRFVGTPLLRLPLLKPSEEPLSPLYADIYRQGAVPSQPITVRTISRFLEYALALSAWKRAGEAQWALRANPSSGNLHPTEGYLLLRSVPGLSDSPGLYHYAPKEHALELRAECPAATLSAIMEPFPPGAFLFGLSSVHWREAWKYGERAFRYCQHDAGHAIGAARIAAATLGWRLVLLDGTSDNTLSLILGLNREKDFKGVEHEHPDCMAVVWPATEDRLVPANADLGLPLFLDPDAGRTMESAQWHGRANKLSREKPVPWEIIDVVAEACWKHETGRTRMPFGDRDEGAAMIVPNPYRDNPLAGRLIRQRRSAVAFDGKTSISAECFYAMLMRVMPGVELPLHQRPVPWDAVPWQPTIHLGLFVHRVDGLAPGLYALPRDPAKIGLLRQALHEQFDWSVPPGCPEWLPLFLLQEGDARRLASQVSCHQDIAGDSAFSLGMLAEFESVLRMNGPWFYRRMFWEAGLLGQVLYLEAEAAGVRATGIGCYFDDPVHQVFGLRDATFQSLYHFTTGGPVEDRRLTTLPPYGDDKI